MKYRIIDISTIQGLKKAEQLQSRGWYPINVTHNKLLMKYKPNIISNATILKMMRNYPELKG